MAASFIIFRDQGIVTIPITGYPGAAPTFRMMMHLIGGRLGLDAIERAAEEAIQGVVEMLQSPDQVRRLILRSE